MSSMSTKRKLGRCAAKIVIGVSNKTSSRLLHFITCGSPLLCSSRSEKAPLSILAVLIPRLDGPHSERVVQIPESDCLLDSQSLHMIIVKEILEALAVQSVGLGNLNNPFGMW